MGGERAVGVLGVQVELVTQVQTSCGDQTAQTVFRVVNQREVGLVCGQERREILFARRRWFTGRKASPRGDCGEQPVRGALNIFLRIILQCGDVDFVDLAERQSVLYETYVGERADARHVEALAFESRDVGHGDVVE